MGFRNQVFFLKNLSKQIKKLTCSQQKPKKESIACNKEKIVKSLPTRLFLYFWLKLHSLFSRKNQSCIVEDVTNIYSRYGCVSWFSGYITPKPSLKSGTANAICWNSLGIFRDYEPKSYFFRNKTILFFKIECWNFEHLFVKEFRETSQDFN